MTTLTLEEMEARSIWEPNTGCLLWMDALFTSGYGCVREKNYGRRRGAHQVMYELIHGPIPSNHVVMHRCDNRPCINPAHLTSGTHDANMRDMVEKGRSARGGRSGSAKLSAEDVINIRHAREAGEPLATIAKRFGVGVANVGHICSRRNWRHVK